MKLESKLIIAFVFLAAVFLALPQTAKATEKIPAPTLLNIDSADGLSASGLTPAGTDVLVYIDGALAGEARVRSENTAADNFYYRPVQTLTVGEHTIQVQARDKESLLLSRLSSPSPFFVKPLPAPTLISPNTRTITSHPREMITGLTVSGTFVRVFIDGVYNGKTKILTHESGTADFAYRPFLNLPAGRHSVYLVAESPSGRQSPVSIKTVFNIEEPLPAPTLLNAPQKYYIEGYTTNNTRVDIYLDHKKVARVEAAGHESGTAHFKYTLPKGLTKQSYLVYTTAIDERGKVSPWSNLVSIAGRADAGQKLDPRISPVAAEEKNGLLDEELAFTDEGPDQSEEELEVEVLSSEEGKDNLTETINENGESDEALIRDLIERPLEEEDGEKGLVNEDKQSQSKLNINLIIFIGFVVLVAFWLIWVNKELIRDQKEQNKQKRLDL